VDRVARSDEPSRAPPQVNGLGADEVHDIKISLKDSP
jgi:hypothetical protein